MNIAYSANSLEEIAQEFERQANLVSVQMGRSKHERAVNGAYMRGLRDAADFLRKTTLKSESAL